MKATTADPEQDALMRRKGHELAHPPPGDEVCITGISGYFPESDNMHQLRDNLLANRDLVTEDDRRWSNRNEEIPHRMGKISTIDRFDASFFGVHPQQAHTMDPMVRLLLEKTYEAVLDAGVNPVTLEGKKVGVYIGCCFSESEKKYFYDSSTKTGLAMTGCMRTMLSNRISYALKITGQSISVDTACSSSMISLDLAYRAIRSGLCEAAIVGGCNICLHPSVSLQFARLGVLSTDGRCKPFSDEANGYARSECVSVVFLQKARHAHRVYATVLHCKTNCDGYKDQGITYPSGEMQQRLMEDIYEELKLDPRLVQYIEAHGTGTKVGDPEELNAIDHVFCQDREDPLYIGSIKSNLGHTEPSSAVAGIAKVIIAFETGVMPATINVRTTRRDIDSLQAGRLKVVLKNTDMWDAPVGVSSFGFGGTNGHVVLRWNPKVKREGGRPADDLPRLVCYSSRTASGANVMADFLAQQPLDAEYVALYHAVFQYRIPNHTYRGYVLLDRDRGVLAQDNTYVHAEFRRICFVFSGMGCQWPAMGREMLRLPKFKETIQACAEVVQPLGVDLLAYLCGQTDDQTMTSTFVSIVAMQIALVEVLKTVNVYPDLFMGHSLGELACAYMDGCMDLKEALTNAFFRGETARLASKVRGAMVAVGLGSHEIKPLLPPEIDIACYNSSSNCTIAGPEEAVNKFTEKLQKLNVFFKAVNTGNVAYHSRYCRDAAKSLQIQLENLIKPRRRSAKWISSSVLEDQWGTPAAQYCSAEYFSNNMSGAVYFEHATRHIPKDAIVLEIAPHALMQAILKRSLHQSVANVGLMQKGHPDNVAVFLTALGRIYNASKEMKLEHLYPAVQWPVSRSTPMIAPLVRWDHSTQWDYSNYDVQMPTKSTEVLRVITTKTMREMVFIEGHIIDGRTIVPATNYLHMVWEVYATMCISNQYTFDIVFENVKYLRSTTIQKDGKVELKICIHLISGRFEIIEGDTNVCTGYVRHMEAPEKEMASLPVLKFNQNDLIESRDFYKELRLRGYNYSGLFRSMKRCTVDGRVGEIAWHNNYVAFMDNLLQIQLLVMDFRSLFVPTSIDKVMIHTSKMREALDKCDPDNPTLLCYNYPEIKTVKCAGIEIKGMHASSIGRRKPLGEPVLETYTFVPNVAKGISIDDALRSCLQTALENAPKLKVKTVEVLGDQTLPLSCKVREILGDLPLIQCDAVVLTAKPLEDVNVRLENAELSSYTGMDFVLGSNLLGSPEMLKAAINSLKPDGFLVSREEAGLNPALLNLGELQILMDHETDQERILFLNRKSQFQKPFIVDVSDTKDFSWLSTAQKLVSERQPTLLFAKDSLSGVIGLVNCIRKEPAVENVSAMLLLDPQVPPFSLDLPFYRDQLEKNLAVNVFKDGQWGTYRHLLIPEPQPKDLFHGFIRFINSGDLSSSRMVSGECRPEDYERNEYVMVHYASLNFRDIMLATNRITKESTMTDRKNDSYVGFEYSGITNRGRRVAGMMPRNCISNMVPLSPLSFEVPAEISLQDAATLPAVYGTVLKAYDCLPSQEPGKSILIHAGTGGVGMAAIHCAHLNQWEVFTTVGTPEKREYLKKMFPFVKDDHIGNSRDCSFEIMIMTMTHGKGVDIVLNSLSEEKLMASIRCVKTGGHFLEIGKFDMMNNTSIGLRDFMGITFCSIMLDSYLMMDGLPQKALADRILARIATGVVKPLPSTVFKLNQIEEAFRYMATGKHMGKVMIEVQEEIPGVKIPEVRPIKGFPRFYCSPNKSYVILGGLGGFGLELADWLVMRNARNLVLTSRVGVRTGYQVSRIRLWKSYGVQVRVMTEDISTQAGIEKILSEALKLGSVEGIYNLAVVLKDGIFMNQTHENFKTSFQSKAVATRLLDEASRKMCPDLKHFVVFSSVSCGRGNAGQSNYGMSNSVMERICEQRRSCGLPALAIEWGAVGDVGLVAEMQEDHTELEISGTLQQRISSCLEVLDDLLESPEPLVSSMVVAEKRILGTGGITGIVEMIANVLGLRDLKSISVNTTLAELGMDSIMVVEVRQLLEQHLDFTITLQDVRMLTFAKLKELQEKGGGGGTSSHEQVNTQVFWDEDKGAQEIVEMRNIGPDEPTVFLIPGMEGSSKIFQEFTKDLPVNAVCLQLTPDLDGPVQEIAKELLRRLLASYEISEGFTIVAHSYGVLVAMEVCILLEAQGMRGTLVALDGSPLQVRLTIQHLNVTDQEQYENSIVRTILAQFMSSTDQTLQRIATLKTLDSKLDLLVESVSQVTPLSKAYISTCYSNIVSRGKNGHAYQPSKKRLDSHMVLLAPQQQTIAGQPTDLGLGQFAPNELQPILLPNCDHRSILVQPEVQRVVVEAARGQLKGKKPLLEVPDLRERATIA